MRIDDDLAKIRFGIAADPRPGKPGLDQRGLHEVLGAAPVLGQQVGQPQQARPPRDHERLVIGSVRHGRLLGYEGRSPYIRLDRTRGLPRLEGKNLSPDQRLTRLWQAIAAAATTLRESTPRSMASGLIGMQTASSASLSQCED